MPIISHTKEILSSLFGKCYRRLLTFITAMGICPGCKRRRHHGEYCCGKCYIRECALLDNERSDNEYGV